MPNSLGPQNVVVRQGLEPCRYSDLELSHAYKARPHTRATDILPERIRTSDAAHRRRGCVHHQGDCGAPSRIRTHARRLRRPSTVRRPGHSGADIGSRTRQRRRWQRYLTPCASANWSGWQELHLRPPGSGPGRLLLTYTLLVRPDGFAPTASRLSGECTSACASDGKVVRTAGLEPAWTCSQGRRPTSGPHPENWTRRLDLRQPPPLCRRVPDYLGHGVILGVADWICTSYSGFTVRGLSTSPSTTTVWYRRQASNLYLTA